MLTALLNPRVLLVAALVILFGACLFKIQVQKTAIAKVQGEKAILEQMNQDLGQQIVALEKMVTTLKANLQAAKQSIKEMQAVRAEANELRRRLIELQNEPQTCEFLKVQYEKVASDITTMFNSGVRRKIDRPDTSGDRTAPEVLPRTTAAATS